MRRVLIGVMLLALVSVARVSAEVAQNAPWWKEQKIRFMWGFWALHNPDKGKDIHAREIPREVFRNVALSGATVFADLWRTYSPDNARYAHEFGMKYFAWGHMDDFRRLTSNRIWVNESGEEQWYDKDDGESIKCPLDELVYEEWLVKPYLEGAREGMIDGIHVDWEGLEGSICYCDDCFSKFLEIKGIKEDLPEKAKRFPWLKERKLIEAYEQNFHQRRVEMFTRVREKLQAVKPDLLFSSYNVLISDFTRAMHTPETPFIILDARHYYNDDRQPWWESYSSVLRDMGYLYIPGGWTNSLFGSQASQVSAARWIYEASINEDGCWIWFEHELTDEILGAYATADREIRTVQEKVGRFLFRGTRDLNFVTAVEWSGRPELECAVIHRTYHLGNEHLAHISNVDADWPLRVRVRFPRLAAGKRWTVRDPLGELYYTRDGKSSVWTSDQLLAGVTVSMDSRSDLFLLVSPAVGRVEVDRSRLIYSREIDTMPEHEAASAAAGAVIPAEVQSADGTSDRLVYTATEQMLFEGSSGMRSIIGNAIRTVDTDGGRGQRVRQLRGYLWSPSYSSDGKRIAFVHDAGGHGQIYVINADGSKAVDMSRNRFCDRSPVWSPDGTRIAFVSDRTGDWDIYVMNADGSSQRRLAGNPGLDRVPAWSPDGGRIAWESRVSGMPNIWVCDADGKNSRAVAARDRSVTGYAEHQIRNRELANGCLLELDQAKKDFWLGSPVWSPDGKRIAGVGLSSQNMVFVLEADGSSMLLVIPDKCHAVRDLCWSPDGTRLAGSWRTAPQETERSGIFVVKADGTDEHSYGRWLVDVTPQGPRMGGANTFGLMTWYSHGSAQPRRVVKSFYSLAWSPDSKTLAFSSDMDPSGAFYVYTIPAEGGTPRKLEATQSAWPNEISWQPR